MKIGNEMFRLASALAIALLATGAAAQSERPVPQGQTTFLGTAPAGGNLPRCPGTNFDEVLIQRCASDEDLVIFDRVVLDEDGLFPVCVRTVPFCVPEGVGPEGIATPGGVDGVRMIAMLRRFVSTGESPPRPIMDLANVGGGDPLSDTTITCNDETNICTCVSTSSGDCEVKLGALCEDAESFGSNGGVGTGCPTGNDS
jgi:hypothetical protein